MKREKTLVIVSYALVYLVWGSTYFFIKAAVTTIPAPLVVSFRFLAGSFLLAALAMRRGALKQLPSLKEVGGSALIGVFLLLLGNGLITIAEKTIPSYTASLIIACMPFYIALFNFILYRTGVSAIRFAGVAVGVAGIGALLYDGNSVAASLSPAVLIAVGGALAWGFGTSVAKALPKAKDPILSTAIQMLVAGISAFAVGAAGEPELLGKLAGASAWSLFGLAYLAVFGSIALVAYNHLLAVEPSFRISSYSLVNPLIAVLLGLAAGEKATPWLFFGVPLVLAGLTLMLYGDALLTRLAARKESGPTAP